MGLYEILIEKLLVDAWVGIHPHEQRFQTVVFDVVIELEGNLGKEYDEIGHTLNYEFVVSEIKKLCRNNQYQLVETLASETTKLLLNFPRVTQVSVIVGKANILSTKQVSVKICRMN